MCLYFVLDDSKELKKFIYPQSQSLELCSIVAALGWEGLPLKVAREGELLEPQTLIHPDDEIAFLPEVLINPISWRQSRLMRKNNFFSEDL